MIPLSDAIRFQMPRTVIETPPPTVWLEPGAVAEMKGIGSSKMTFTLESSLDAVRPWMNLRQANCGDGAEEGTQDYSIDDPFELR